MCSNKNWYKNTNIKILHSSFVKLHRYVSPSMVDFHHPSEYLPELFAYPCWILALWTNAIHAVP